VPIPVLSTEHWVLLLEVADEMDEWITIDTKLELLVVPVLFTSQLLCFVFTGPITDLQEELKLPFVCHPSVEDHMSFS
jgi:hypothetical protein